MAAIIKASSAIIKAKKFIPQRKSNTAAKVQSKSVSLVPRGVQNNNNPSGKLVKSPSEGLVKYNQEEDVTKINPTPIRKKDDPILNLLKQIESKVIKVDKLLKTSLLGKRKLNEKGRVTKEREKFKKREGELEKGEKSIPGLPKMGGGIIGGFLEGVKRFFFFTMLGWVFFRILPLLPKLKSIAGFIGKAIDFGFTLFSGLVSGLTTFLAEGIKLTNSITKSIGWLSGARTEEDFNKFEKTFNRIVDLTILAAMLTADAGLDLFKNKGRPRGNVQPRPRPGVGGRPGVTTSGGRSAGRFGNVRERLRNANPLRQQPSVTTSGGRNINSGSRMSEGLRNANPLRNRPRVTSSGGRSSGGFRLPKINFRSPGMPKGFKMPSFKGAGRGGLLSIGIMGVEMFMPQIQDAMTGFYGSMGFGDRKLTDADLTKKILEQQAEYKKLAKQNAQMPGGQYLTPSEDEYNFGNLSALKREAARRNLQIPGQLKGGIVGRSGINGYAKGGSIVQPTVKSTNIHILSKKPENIKSKKTIPGKDVGGENQIKKIFLDTSPEEISITKTISSALNPLASIFNFLGGGSGASQETIARTKSKNTRGLPNPFQLLLKTSKIFKEDPRSQGTSLDFINKISASAVDTLLGNKPDKGIYRSIASSILFLANSIANKQIYGVKSSISSILGFASGGNVPSTSATNSKNIVESQESTLRSLTDSIGFSMEQTSNKVLDSVRGEARKAGASRRGRPVGRDEMVQENIRRGQTPSGGTPPGGRTPPGGGTPPGGNIGASSGTPNERALLDMISQAEGTTASYGVVSGGDINRDLESGKLTVKQVIDLANGFGTPGSKHKWSGATGRYQFMPTTLSNLVRLKVLKLNDKFTPAMQDKAALALVRLRGVDPTKQLTNKDIYRLGGEWAALEGGPNMRAGGSYPTADGRSQVKYNARQALEIYSTKLRAAQQTQSSVRGGQSRVSSDILAFRQFRSEQFRASAQRRATADPDYYQIREMGVFGSGNYGINPIADDTSYEIDVHKGAGHWENRAFDIPVPINSREGDRVAEFWRKKGYTVLWKLGPGDHDDHVHVEVPKEKAQEWFKVVQPQIEALSEKPRPGTLPGETLFFELHANAAGQQQKTGLIQSYLHRDNPLFNALSSVYGEFPRDFRDGDLGGPRRGMSLIELVGMDSEETNAMLNEKTRQEFINKHAKKLFDVLKRDPNLRIKIFAGHADLTVGPTGTSGTASGRSIGGKTIEQAFTIGVAARVAELAKKEGLTNIEYVTSVIANGGNDDPNANWNRALAMRQAELKMIEEQKRLKDRPVGAQSILFNKPVVWDGNKWIPRGQAFGGRMSTDEVISTVERVLNLKPSDKPVVIPGIGSIRMGKDWFGRPQKKYFNRIGVEISSDEFNNLMVKYKYPPEVLKVLREEKGTEAAKARPGATPPARPGARPGARPQRAWWDPRGWVGKEEGGPVIGKSQPNIPIPNKFASYESPQSKNFIALQQIIVEKPSMDRSKRVAPSPSSSNALNSSRMNRMQSTSRS